MSIIDVLKNTFPNGKLIDNYTNILDSSMEAGGINTPKRKAAFLSQIGHESAGFSRIEENLMYSAKRLLEVFPKYFTADSAKIAEYKPQMIANKIYANRMGNSGEYSNDGYNYRGRGLIQLTGKYNYQKCGFDLNQGLTSNPDWLLTPEGSLKSAIWYWNSRNCNQYADKGDIIGLTKAINGGTIGLDDRQRLYNSLLSELQKEKTIQISLPPEHQPQQEQKQETPKTSWWGNFFGGSGN